MKDRETTAGHQSKQLKTKLLGIQENLEITLVIKHTTVHTLEDSTITLP